MNRAISLFFWLVLSAQAEEPPRTGYLVPPIIPSMQKALGDQTSPSQKLDLISEDRTEVRITSVFLRGAGQTSFQAIYDQPLKTRILNAFTQMTKGVQRTEVAVVENQLTFEGKPIELKFSVVHNGSLADMPLENNKAWNEAVTQQIKAIQELPKLERFEGYNGKKIYFGITVDGKQSSDVAEEQKLSMLVKAVIAIAELPDEPTISVSPEGEMLVDGKQLVRIVFFYQNNQTGTEFSAADQAALQRMWRRHLRAVVQMRSLRSVKIAPAFPKLAVPTVEEPEPTKSTSYLKFGQFTGPEFVKRINGWQSMMSFVSQSSPILAKKIQSLVNESEIFLDPTDSLATPTLEVEKKENIWVTDLVEVEGSKITLANGTFSRFSEGDRVYTLLYAYLVQIPGISEKALVLTSKIKMHQEYLKKSSLPLAEFEAMIFECLMTKEIRQANRWLRELAATRKDQSERTLAGQTVGVSETLARKMTEAERELHELRNERLIRAFQDCFGERPLTISSKGGGFDLPPR